MTARNETGARWLPVRIEDFEKWQEELLEESASRLGAVLAPAGRVHRRDSVGSPVTFRGERAWLRVSPFLEHEMSRKAWRGTAEAAAIPGVSKPALLHRIEWHTDGPAPVPVSAEVLTLVTDPLASRERFLRTAPDLPADWFSDLSASLAALRAYPTGSPVPGPRCRGVRLPAQRDLPPAGPRRLRSGLRDRAHRPELGEHHRSAFPASSTWSTGAWPSPATAPPTSTSRRSKSRPSPPGSAHALADVLDTPSGRYAQLVAAALILRNLTRLPDPGGLAARLHRYTDTLLA